MRTILLPTDFSVDAETALNYAIEMAGKAKMKIVLLHVYHVPPVKAHASTLANEQEIKAEEANFLSRLKQLQTRIDHAGGIISECKVRMDLAVDGILKEAAEVKADLIIMGTKGASGLREVFFGSNTARIIEQAGCPVIAIPVEAKFRGIRHITYAGDYNKSEIKALKKLVDLARSFNAQLNILHIYTKDEPTAMEAMREYKLIAEKELDYGNLSFQLLHGERVEEGLEEFTKSGATDLLVLSTHKRDLIDRLFGSSITKRLAYHTTVPLMAFHYKKKESVILF